MTAWSWRRPTTVRIVVTATGPDGSVMRWYQELREGPETIALPAYTRSVTIERPRRVRVHLGQLRAARGAR
jgi:hypothetical protein